MAATDVKLPISVTVEGVDAIRRVADDVRELAKQGAGAAPEFTKLANEFDKLADQAGALAVVKELAADVDRLKTEQATAAQGAVEYRTRLAQLNEVVKQTATRQQEARDAIVQARNKVGEAKDALDAYRATATDSTRQTSAYRAEVKRLVDDLNTQKAALRALKTDQADATKSMQAARAAVRDFKTENQGVDAAVRQANAALAQRTRVFDETALSLQKAGIETDDLAAATDRVRQALQQATVAVEQQQAAVVRSAAEQERLARISDAVAQSNLRNVRLAQAAAAERTLAERQAAAAAEESAARQAEAQRRALVTMQTALRGTIEAQERVKRSAAEAAAAFEQTFATVGVRSAQAIEREIAEVNAALQRLARNAQVSGADFTRAFDAGTERIRRLRAELAGVPAEIEKTSNRMEFLGGQLRQLAALYSGVELARNFFEANVELERLTRSLTVVTGSVETANQQIAFLQRVAENSGQSVGRLTDDFLRFQAASAGAGKDLGFTNDIFEQVTNAAGRLGVSTDRVGLIFNALTQTISKGKPTLEEVQGQLSESLPGALSILSRGLGVTTERFLELIKTGQITNDVFFAALRRGLNEVTGETAKVEGLAASWNRFKNALTETAQRANDSSAFNALSGILDGLASNMSRVVDGALALGKAFVAIKAVTAVQSFLGLANGAKAAEAAQTKLLLATREATLAAVDNTAKTGLNTAAKVTNAAETARANVTHEAGVVAARAEAIALDANTAATARNNAAKAGTALALGTVEKGSLGFSAAAIDAAAKGGLMARAFSTLAGAGRTAFAAIGGLPGVLLATVVARKELGEGIADLAAEVTGLADKQRQLDAQIEAENAALAENAKRMRDAKDAKLVAQFAAANLTTGTKQLVDVFKAEVESGKSVEESLDKIAKAMRLDGGQQGIRDAVSALRELATSSKLTAEQIKTTLGTALDGIDLSKVAANAEAAFGRMGEGGRNLRLILDAIGNESLKRVGTSVEELQTGFDATFNKAINDTTTLDETLERLGVRGETTGRLLAQSLDKAFEVANTKDELEKVIDATRRLYDQGRITFEDYFSRVQAGNARLDDMREGVNSLDEAFRNFGITSRTELNLTADKLRQSYEVIRNSTQVTLAQQIEAFGKYREAAIAANGGVESSQVKLEAAILQSRAAAAGLGSEFKKAMGEGAAATDKATGSMLKFVDAILAAEKARDKFNSTAGAGSVGGDAIKKRNEETKSNLGEYDENGRLIIDPNATYTDGTPERQEGTFFDNQAFQRENQFAFRRIAGSGGSRNMRTPDPARFTRTAEQTEAAMSGSSTTVNINLNGRQTSIAVGSRADADALTDLFRQLELDASRS
jgi:tape measure domain-containing protein